jgi:hypothetical protein
MYLVVNLIESLRENFLIMFFHKISVFIVLL